MFVKSHHPGRGHLADFGGIQLARNDFKQDPQNLWQLTSFHVNSQQSTAYLVYLPGFKPKYCCLHKLCFFRSISFSWWTSELELYTLALLLRSVIESFYKQSHYIWHYICVNLRSIWELYKVCSHTLWGTDHLYSSHIYHHLPSASNIYHLSATPIIYPLSASIIIYHHLSSSHPWVYC